MSSGWERVEPAAAVKALMPNVRTYVRWVDDGMLKAFRTYEQEEPGAKWLQHLSISHEHRHPTWEEQRDAVWDLMPGKRAAQYLPPRGYEYVNVHEHTFHWWEQP